MKKQCKRFLAIMLMCICFLGTFNSEKVYAAMSDEAQYYELGETYTGSGAGGGTYGGTYKYYKFTISEKSHVTIYVKKQKEKYSVDYPSVDIFNSSGKNVIPDEDMQWKYNSTKEVYSGQQYRVLGKGTYYIRFHHTGDFSFRVQAEKQIKLSRGAISTLKTSKKGQMTVKCKSATNAIGYRITIATNEKFTKNKKVIYNPSTTKTIKNLKGGCRYYVKVCPYTVYDDGIRVFGQNSSVKTIVVKK